MSTYPPHVLAIYGRYTAHLLHSNGDPEEAGRLANLGEQLNDAARDVYGLAIARWSPAFAAYHAECHRFGYTPTVTEPDSDCVYRAFYAEGARVVATQTVTERGGEQEADPAAEFPAAGYVHAERGDEGTVVYVDTDGFPTVRFDRTGTATIVSDWTEIEPAPPVQS